MFSIKPLTKQGCVIYEYDGSFTGFLSCAYQCFMDETLPLGIYAQEEDQRTLWIPQQVTSDTDKSDLLINAVIRQSSHRAFEIVAHAFLSCLENKEMQILSFLSDCSEYGSHVEHRIIRPAVHFVWQAEKQLLREAHLYTGFIRFIEYEQKLIAVIDPKNQVLPIIAPHFMQRYGNETFLIFDTTHRSALMHHRGQMSIDELTNLHLPTLSDKETLYQALWKCFYDTIGIADRNNPRCRRTHMPKRYWNRLPEMQ